MAVAVTLAACTHYQAEPLDANASQAAFLARSLDEPAVTAFVSEHLPTQPETTPAVNLELGRLIAAAYYLSPAVRIARASHASVQLEGAVAAVRPNPVLILTPGYSLNPGDLSPWLPTFGLDFGVTTAGKRAARMQAAAAQTTRAEADFNATAWMVRGSVRDAAIGLAAAVDRHRLFSARLDLAEHLARIADAQFRAGQLSGVERNAVVVQVLELRAGLLAGQQALLHNRTALATAIGVPTRALEPGPERLPDVPAISADALQQLQETVSLRRFDLLGALADYAGAEAALRLEVAKQYPDLRLGPSYQWDQGQRKWSLAVAFEIPVLNRNQAAIRVAQSRRLEQRARFEATQAQALASADTAVAVYRGAIDNVAVVVEQTAREEQHLAAARAQGNAGMAEPRDTYLAESESLRVQAAQVDAREQLLLAIGQLEDALQVEILVVTRPPETDAP